MGISFLPIAVLLLAQQEVNPELVPVGVQPPKSVAIDGKVVDASSRVAIAGATVNLQYATSPIALRSVTTEMSGAFHLSLDRPGDYAVEASKEGYLTASKKVRIDKTNLSDITLAMLSSARITGTIRDADTKKGLAGFTVSALRVRYFHGQRETLAGGITFTDEQGDFGLDGLQPGDYFLEIKKFPQGTILPDPRAEMPASQRRYPQTIWPGDALASDSIPLAVSPGETDIGYVNLAKIEPGRMRGDVVGLDCAKDSSYELTVQQRFGSRTIEERAASVPCGSGFTVPDLSPGLYRVWARPLSGVLQLAVADVRVESGSELDVHLPVREWPRVSGGVTFDCKADCSVTEVQSVSLLPVNRDLSNDPALRGSEARVDEAGTFQGVMPLSGPIRAAVAPLPENLFIKHVIYNGAEVGPVFQPNPSLSLETLRIVLSDQLSELSGIVQQEGQPLLKTHVVLAPWPLIANDGWSAASVVETDSEGQFHFRGLTAGTYRAVSLKSDEWERRDLPGVLTGWLAAGEDIALGDAESKSVVLK